MGRKKFDDENIIKLMYDMYISNNSLGSIANLLNTSKVKAPRGGTWDRSSVHFILNDKENLVKYLDLEMHSKFTKQKEKNTKNKKK